MRTYKISVVAAIVLAIAGCTTNHGSTFHERYMRSTYGENEAMYPNPSDCMDPVKFLQAYVKADHKKVIAPLDALAETMLWDMEDGVEHVTMTVPEYLPHDSTRSSGQMLLAMYDVCSKNAGRMSGHWCFKYANTQLVPLFYFDARQKPRHRGTDRISAKLIVPKAGNPLSRAWLDYATPQFDADALETYEKNKITHEETLAAIRVMQTQVNRIKNKDKENEYLLSSQGRGSKVCQRRVRGTTAIGYVEDSNAGRIKVNIAFIGYPPNVTVGGFRPFTEWGYPNDWWLCE